MSSDQNSCDWKELIHPETKQKYYHNKVTNKSTYDRPKEYDLYVAKLKIKFNLEKSSLKKSSEQLTEKDTPCLTEDAIIDT